MSADQERIARHELWRRPLVRTASAGTLGKSELAFVHCQLDVLSRLVDRAVASVMAGLDDDVARSKLARVLARSMNAGEAEPLETTPLEGTALVARELLEACRHDDPAVAAASLVFGVVVVGARVRGAFSSRGRLELAPSELLDALRPFLRDEATTAAIDHALALYLRFVDGLHLALEQGKSAPILERIRARKSLLTEGTVVHCHAVDDARTLYESDIPKLDVKFTVDRLPFDAEVIDARVVRIPSGKRSELHRHAHESLFFVIDGEGEISVESSTQRVRKGDVVFAPRWAMHQSTNTGQGELVLLGITDFYLTSKVQLVGNGEGRLKKPSTTRSNGPSNGGSHAER